MMTNFIETTKEGLSGYNAKDKWEMLKLAIIKKTQDYSITNVTITVNAKCNG